MAKVNTTIPDVIDERFKNRRKTVTGVDLTQRNGFAFQGDFLRAGRRDELEAGTFALFYDEVGTARHHPPEVRFAQLNCAGNWVQVVDHQGEIRARGIGWALDLRDRVAAIIAASRTPNAGDLTIEEWRLVEALRTLPADRRARVLQQVS